jgi:heme/copper-type cytochrome/quinol oxidase subunit 3
MTAVAALSGPTDGRQTRGLGWWAMGMFVLSEAVLFSLLLVSYFYLWSRQAGRWPPDGISPPDLSWPTLMTGVLVASSIPVHLAVKAEEDGDVARARGMVLTGAALGFVFVGLQASEYVRTAHEFTPRTNPYGSMFFTVTGFHGLHVCIGLALLLWGALRTGRTDRARRLPVLALYWHFVDVVWLAVFTSLYLLVAL